MVEQPAMPSNRRTRPRKTSREKPTVVTIGASAGGLAALQRFFDTIPERTGAAFVVVVHLDPEHRSELPQILAGRTRMPVTQVNGTEKLEPDHIYVMPPDRRVQVIDHEISSAAFDEPRGKRAPIDLFFRSLAERVGDGFAVVLSGAGSDGAVGVRAVKEAGGVILVQDPQEAEYSSMPRSAIASGVADFVLPARDLAARLVELIRLKRTGGQVVEPQVDEELLRRVLAHLRGRTGHDFSKYKRSTVLRRLARRMQVTRTDNLHRYYEILRENTDEAQALLSVNEEYRSTSEELETSKEDLQSINEELQTVNTELKLKLEAISRAHSDLQNLLAATDFGTLFLDSNLRIKRFTERAKELFSITTSDEGRSIGDFSHQLDYDDLIQDARKVLSDLAPIRKEIRSRNDLWYDMRMRPYRTVDNKIDGIVITFVDITERLNAEQALRDSERQLQQEKRLVELSRAPIFVWELDGGIVEWNRGCEELYGYTRQEALGRRKEMLLRTEVPGSSFAELTSRLRSEGVWSGELVHHTKDGRTLAIDAQLELESLEGRKLVLESTRDITDRKAWAERQVMLRRELTHRLKNMLAVVQSIARQTMHTHPSPQEFTESFNGRMTALGSANSLLSEADWESADLAGLVRRLLAPYAPEGSARYRLEGEPLSLSVDIASPFGLVLHELATNAAKYGSLSRTGGTVLIKWTVKSTDSLRVLEFIWEERGARQVREPAHASVGSALIENAIPNSTVNREFHRDGLVCTIQVPL